MGRVKNVHRDYAVEPVEIEPRGAADVAVLITLFEQNSRLTKGEIHSAEG